MTIAELYVELGIKGDGKAQKAITNVQAGVHNISTSAIEAKAAILALFYGLERLTSSSNKLGTSLVNFESTTGLDPVMLQKWSYAASQAGASNEEMASSFVNLQQKMAALVKEGKGVEGMPFLQKYIDKNKTKASDTVGMMKNLVEFAQDNKKNPAMIKSYLDSFGISQGVQNAMFRGFMTDKKINAAPAFSQGGVKALDNMRRQWANLAHKIEMDVGKLNIQFGAELIPQITKLTEALLELVGAFAKFADKTKLIERIGDGLSGFSFFIKQITPGSKITDKDIQSNPFTKLIKWVTENPDFQKGNNFPGNQGNVTVNQNLNFQHDGKNPEKIKKSHNDAAKQAHGATYGSSSSGSIPRKN